jgi:alpha-beta hydrolase superfamily lysophospholipase
VAIAHGYGEHGERYARLAERLTAAGFKTWAPDHRGHGISEGPRGVVDRLSNAVTDLDAVVEMARAETPRGPVFLLGHSMGGAIALAYALGHQDKLAGLVLSAPATSYKDRTATPLALRAPAAVASVLVPRAPAHTIDQSNLTRDPAELQAYVDDPMIHRRPQPARTVGEMLTAFARFHSEAPTLRLPLLVVHGTADRITSPEGSRRIVERAGSADKELRLYDGFFHELLNEPRPDRDRVMDDIVAWLQGRAGGAD